MGEVPAVSGLQQRCEVFKCSFKVLMERRAIGDGTLARESTGATVSLRALVRGNVRENGSTKSLVQRPLEMFWSLITRCTFHAAEI